MDEDCFTFDTSGDKNNSAIKYDSPSSGSLSSESLPSQSELENDLLNVNKLEIEEDIAVLDHIYTVNDESDLIVSLRSKIYSLVAAESFCKSLIASDNSVKLTICKNGLTNKLNEMSFLLRHNCGRSYPRFLRYTKVPLSKHVIQTAKRYYANIPDLSLAKNCPEPAMDFTHCLSSLYLLPKEMCTGCGRRDCKKTWHSNKPCDYYPCDNCGQYKHHQCKYIHDLTSRRSQKDRELPHNVRDYLASSIKCLICGRIGHPNCATNAPTLSNNTQSKYTHKHSHFNSNRIAKDQKPHFRHNQR